MTPEKRKREEGDEGQARQEVVVAATTPPTAAAPIAPLSTVTPPTAAAALPATEQHSAPWMLSVRLGIPNSTVTNAQMYIKYGSVCFDQHNVGQTMSTKRLLLPGEEEVSAQAHAIAVLYKLTQKFYEQSEIHEIQKKLASFSWMLTLAEGQQNSGYTHAVENQLSDLKGMAAEVFSKTSRPTVKKLIGDRHGQKEIVKILQAHPAAPTPEAQAESVLAAMHGILQKFSGTVPSREAKRAKREENKSDKAQGNREEDETDIEAGTLKMTPEKRKREEGDKRQPRQEVVVAATTPLPAAAPPPAVTPPTAAAALPAAGQHSAPWTLTVRLDTPKFYGIERGKQIYIRYGSVCLAQHNVAQTMSINRLSLPGEKEVSEQAQAIAVLYKLNQKFYEQSEIHEIQKKLASFSWMLTLAEKQKNTDYTRVVEQQLSDLKGMTEEEFSKTSLPTVQKLIGNKDGQKEIVKILQTLSAAPTQETQAESVLAAMHGILQKFSGTVLPLKNKRAKRKENKSDEAEGNEEGDEAKESDEAPGNEEGDEAKESDEAPGNEEGDEAKESDEAPGNEEGDEAKESDEAPGNEEGDEAKESDEAPGNGEEDASDDEEEVVFEVD